MNTPPTVQDLIDELMKIEDKNKPIVIPDTGYRCCFSRLFERENEVYIHGGDFIVNYPKYQGPK